MGTLGHPRSGTHRAIAAGTPALLLSSLRAPRGQGPPRSRHHYKHTPLSVFLTKSFVLPQQEGRGRKRRPRVNLISFLVGAPFGFPHGTFQKPPTHLSSMELNPQNGNILKREERAVQTDKVLSNWYLALLLPLLQRARSCQGTTYLLLLSPGFSSSGSGLSSPKSCICLAESSRWRGGEGALIFNRKHRIHLQPQ